MNIHVITGQTATGKTNQAIALAKKINGELINADSRQVYTKLNIVTGKDLPNDSRFTIAYEQNGKKLGWHTIDADHTIPIWLYDMQDPKLPFSSFDFRTCALRAIADILSRGKTPIIVGGTYFYLSHLLYGVPTEDIPPNWEMRLFLSKLTVQELQTVLIKTDPDIFSTLNTSDRANPQRLIRKIEIASHLKKAGGSYPEYTRTYQSPFDAHQITFTALVHGSSEQLRTYITKRVLTRIEQGAVKEASSLLSEGYAADNPGLQAIGYQQIMSHLSGELSKEQMIEKWVQAEIAYAKRQHTFIKKDKNIAIETV